MGVSSKKLVYDFRRKHNSVNSGRNQDIALVDVIAYLNEAQEIWFENRVFVAQTNQKVRNDLRVFKVDKVGLGCSSSGDGCCLAKYPKDLYHRLNQVTTSCNECCPGIDKRIIPRIVQSDDLHEARRNPYRKADYFFEQLLAVEGSDGLLIYHDNEVDIKNVTISYYRKPKEIHAPSLEECEGANYYNYCGEIITNDQDFEVDDTFAANDVVDIAILKAARDVSDVQGFQTQLQAILNNQRLHK
jgi:hypothetical protein